MSTQINKDINREKKIQLQIYHHFYDLPKYGKTTFTIRLLKYSKKTKLNTEEYKIQWLDIPPKYSKKDRPFCYDIIKKNKLFPFWFIGDVDYKIIFK
jgi:hypothetical protein